MKKHLRATIDLIRNGKYTKAGNSLSEYITEKSKSILNEIDMKNPQIGYNSDKYGDTGERLDSVSSFFELIHAVPKYSSQINKILSRGNKHRNIRAFLDRIPELRDFSEKVRKEIYIILLSGDYNDRMKSPESNTHKVFLQIYNNDKYYHMIYDNTGRIKGSNTQLKKTIRMIIDQLDINIADTDLPELIRAFIEIEN